MRGPVRVIGVAAMALLTTAVGCGDTLVGGDYLGDGTMRLHGIIAVSVDVPARPMVGAVWLGYSALVDPAAEPEPAAYPITSIGFANFEASVWRRPPSVGRYLLADGSILPATIRIARLVVFDDVDRDGRFAVTGNEDELAAPDRLLARSNDSALLFVRDAPVDADALNAAGVIVTNWNEASPGYHLVRLDNPPAAPALPGHIVTNEAPAIFVAPLP
jgi:hypothetical protein